MTDAVVVAGAAVAVVAAARSTWSPCGRSMLSSITPLAERGRGHRYRSTAAWFVAGGLGGGATLGAVMAALAAATSLAALRPAAVGAVAAAACALAALVDLGVTPVRLPLLRRQVNEAWLDGYRPWFYGAGFGWQIGAGFTTYLMTAAVPALVVLGAASRSPLAAFTLGVGFGGLRGLTVLLGARVTEPAALRAVHRRVDALTRPVRAVTVAALAGAAGALAGAAVPLAGAGWAAPAGAAVVAAVVVAWLTAPGRVGAGAGRSRLREWRRNGTRLWLG